MAQGIGRCKKRGADGFMKFLAAAMYVGILIMLLPFVWMLLTSFKTFQETVQLPVSIFPKSINFSNYAEVFEHVDFVRYFTNTILVSVVVTVGQMLLCSLAAYAFARLSFPFKNVILVLMLASLMVPLQMILIPRYTLMIQLGWIDTFWAIIIPNIPSIWSTFFLRQQFMTFPKELDESAILDGCSFFRVFWNILLPLCATGIVTLGILSFTSQWNDFLWPLIVINSEERSVLSIAITRFQGRYTTKNNLVMAFATLATLPLIVCYLFGQRYFMEGIATTGLKA